MPTHNDTGDNFEDTVSQNFTERNNRIIDRFDDFFGRMGIKDKPPGSSLKATDRSVKKSYQSTQSRKSRNSQAERMQQMRRQSQQDTNSSYSRPPSSLEASKESLKEKSLSRSKNSRISNKFNNYNTNVQGSDDFRDSDEERDTMSEQIPPSSAYKNALSSRI
jgi:flagellar biosynthesis GTPase FlhF